MPTGDSSNLSASRSERLRLIESLCTLPLVRFYELVFALDPPKGVMPPSGESMRKLAFTLLEWAEGSGGPGAEVVRDLLHKIESEQTSAFNKKPFEFLIKGELSNFSEETLQAIRDELQDFVEQRHTLVHTASPQLYSLSSFSTSSGIPLEEVSSVELESYIQNFDEINSRIEETQSEIASLRMDTRKSLNELEELVAEL